MNWLWKNASCKVYNDPKLNTVAAIYINVSKQTTLLNIVLKFLLVWKSETASGGVMISYSNFNCA